MEEHLKKRPPKTVFKSQQIDELKDKAIDEIKLKLLPDEKIIKIILIGSSVKNSFGKYEPPGFRGSLFSDFDFIIFVENDFEIPTWLDREPDGKPFSDDNMNLAYRSKKFIDNLYDAEVFFVRRCNLNNPKIQKDAESAGIPMTTETKHKHIVVYEKPTV